MPRIDAHQHFWRYQPQHYPWIDERMSVLRQDFDPPRLRPLLQEQGFDGALAVQARPSEEETLACWRWLSRARAYAAWWAGWISLRHSWRSVWKLFVRVPRCAGCAIRCRTKRIRRPGWRGRK